MVAEGEAGFPLVRSDQIELGEVENVAPPRGDLAVGHLERPARDVLNESGDRVAGEDPMPEVAHDHHVSRRRPEAVADGPDDPVGHRAIVYAIHLEHRAPIGPEALLVGGRSGLIYHGITAHPVGL